MATATLQSEPSIRKAAVLVRSLDAESVAALLSRLSPAEAKAVRQAVRELDEITDEDRQSVAAALRGQRPVPPPAPCHSTGAAVDVELALTDSYAPPAPAAARVPELPAGSSRLGKLSQADAESLVAYLKLEQPPTIAVVLSCLPPQQAAEVLNRLPEQLQGPAFDRLADLGDLDPDSVEVIAAELESWIAQHAQNRRRREDRRAALEAILNASPVGARSRLAKQLARRWPEFRPEPPAEAPTRPAPVEPPRPAIETQQRPPQPSPTPPALPFASLESLNGAQLAEVFSQVDRNTLLVALFGASEGLLERIRGVSSTKQMRALEQSIQMVGPVRLSDITHAQQAVGRAAARLLTPERRAA